MSCWSETGLYSYCMPHKVFVKPTFYQPALFALCLPFPVKLVLLRGHKILMTAAAGKL